MGDKMKIFLELAEISIDDKKYAEIQSWGIDPSDWVTSVLADHGRDRGMVIKMRCMETEYHLLDDVCKAADTIAKDKALDEIEEVVLNNAMCVGGNCEA